MSSLVAELAEHGPGPTLNGWLMMVGDKLADAAQAAADCHGDAELLGNVDELADLWRYLRGQVDDC